MKQIVDLNESINFSKKRKMAGKLVTVVSDIDEIIQVGYKNGERYEYPTAIKDENHDLPNKYLILRYDQIHDKFDIFDFEYGQGKDYLIVDANLLIKSLRTKKIQSTQPKEIKEIPKQISKIKSLMKRIGGFLNLNESFEQTFNGLTNLNESVDSKKDLVGQIVTLTSTIENAELNEFPNQNDLEEGTVLNILSYNKKDNIFTVTDESFENETWNVDADELLASI